jgi:hypothetical protein
LLLYFRVVPTVWQILISLYNFTCISKRHFTFSLIIDSKIYQFHVYFVIFFTNKTYPVYTVWPHT